MANGKMMSLLDGMVLLELLQLFMDKPGRGEENGISKLGIKWDLLDALGNK